MTTTNFCRCGHPADYHNARTAKGWRCVGQARINEAHPDYEPCGCTEYRPRPEPQGRMM